MAKPSTRDQLIDHCLRRLGAPVIEINVDIDQLEDRTDDALQMYQEYHSDAVVRTFLKHQVTSTDITNGYIDVDDSITFIKKLFQIRSTGGSSAGMFDIKYQMSLNEIYDLNTFIGNLAYYEQVKQYLSLIDMQLTGYPQIDFNRHQNRVHIHGKFSEQNIVEGDYLVFETFKIVDPETHTDVYNDIFLKEYLTQLIKQQWGSNLIKFDGMQLPGGVQLNGRQIYDDATQELLRLDEKMRTTYELPVDFFLG
jgi:hypothetical protein